MAHEKWINLNGMLTLDQAKALRDVIDIGLSGAEGANEHDALLHMREELNKAINHIEVLGFAGSGIAVEGHRFVSREEVN